MSGRARRASPGGAAPACSAAARPRARPASAATGAGRSACGTRASSRSRAGPRPARSPTCARGCAAARAAPSAQCCTERAKSLLNGPWPFEQPQAVLELGEAELELLELVAGDEAELPGEGGDALPRPLAEPGRVAAPACERVLEQLPRLVA